MAVITHMSRVRVAEVTGGAIYYGPLLAWELPAGLSEADRLAYYYAKLGMWGPNTGQGYDRRTVMPLPIR